MLNICNVWYFLVIGNIMEVLYGKKNGLSFFISPVVKFRETYIDPYVIEEEISNNIDVFDCLIDNDSLRKYLKLFVKKAQF